MVLGIIGFPLGRFTTQFTARMSSTPQCRGLPPRVHAAGLRTTVRAARQTPSTLPTHSGLRAWLGVHSIEACALQLNATNILLALSGAGVIAATLMPGSPGTMAAASHAPAVFGGFVGLVLLALACGLAARPLQQRRMEVRWIAAATLSVSAAIAWTVWPGTAATPI